MRMDILPAISLSSGAGSCCEDELLAQNSNDYRIRQFVYGVEWQISSCVLCSVVSLHEDFGLVEKPWNRKMMAGHR